MLTIIDQRTGLKSALVTQDTGGLPSIGETIVTHVSVVTEKILIMQQALEAENIRTFRCGMKAKREFDTCYKVKDLVKKADKYFRRWQKDRSNTDARSSYQEVMEDLAKMINERTEHSATARATLKTFRRADRVWVDELLTA